MYFSMVFAGECCGMEEALNRIELIFEDKVNCVRVQKKGELFGSFSCSRALLAVLPVEWLEESERLRDCLPCVRILVYGSSEEMRADAIAGGADHYLPITAMAEQWVSTLHSEYKLLYADWKRNASRFAREKARNQLIYARIKDSFENTTIAAINQKFHFRFQEGLFRVILLRIDYTNQNRDLFDWFYLFDETVVVQILEYLQEICYDVYVEFRMNGPMFYCNYAEDKDGKLFEIVKLMCDKLLRVVAANEKLQLSVRIGSAYHDIQNLQKSKEETYNAYQEYARYDRCEVLLYGENESAGVWNNKRVQQIRDKFCAAGANLDIRLLDQCVAELKSMDLKSISNLFLRFIEHFFDANARLIESYTNPEHARKKMIQTINFSGTKEVMIQNFLRESHTLIEEILHAAPRGVRVIHRARRYVADHYMEKISVTTISDYFELNASYFSHLFMKETGQHFSDFVLEFRIHKAMELLTMSNLSVREIAENVGYPDQRYFSRMFRKVMSKNPTEFRKNSSHTNL